MSVLAVRSHVSALRDMLRMLTMHRRLTWEMAKREITEKYSGQVLGAAWAIGHPLALMGVYIFMFAVVFKMKIGGTLAMPLDYTAYLLSGLIPWMGFQESLNKSANAIVSQANLVKQVVFPIEVLPIKGCVAALLTQFVAMTILTVYVLVSHGGLPPTYALIPVLVFFQFIAMCGAGLLLSALSPYFRDLKDFVQVFCVCGMYFMPIFYLPEHVPSVVRPLLYFNPFSYLAWCWQDVCYFGRFEHPWAWPVFCFGSVLLLYVGYRVFRKLKVGFGSVL